MNELVTYRVECHNCGHVAVFRIMPNAEKAIAGMVCQQCGGPLANSTITTDRGKGPADPRRKEPL